MTVKPVQEIINLCTGVTGSHMAQVSNLMLIYMYVLNSNIFIMFITTEINAREEPCFSFKIVFIYFNFKFKLLYTVAMSGN